jgi:hypothetical protein
MSVIKEVDIKLNELNTFFQTKEIIELVALIEIRKKLDEVLKNLKEKIDLQEEQNKFETPNYPIVTISYYENYENMKGGILKNENSSFLSYTRQKFNLQIDLYNILINEIIEIIKEPNKIRIIIDGYIKECELLYNSLLDHITTNYIKEENSLIPKLNIPFFKSNDHETPENKKSKLFKYINSLKYFIDTTCKYKKIVDTPPIINPHLEPPKTLGGGSYKKSNKKNILGRERCIYKKSGDRKEYIKYKGVYIAIREYKKLMKKTI